VRSRPTNGRRVAPDGRKPVRFLEDLPLAILPITPARMFPPGVVLAFAPLPVKPESRLIALGRTRAGARVAWAVPVSIHDVGGPSSE
jgi:hypothetical protein